MSGKLVNLAVQVLPESRSRHPYDIVDEAIKLIADSGFVYRVCPFETVVECTLDEGLDLIREIHKICRLAGAGKMMAYIKIQTDFEGDVKIDDKMEKYV